MYRSGRRGGAGGLTDVLGRPAPIAFRRAPSQRSCPERQLARPGGRDINVPRPGRTKPQRLARDRRSATIKRGMSKASADPLPTIFRCAIKRFRNDPGGPGRRFAMVGSGAQPAPCARRRREEAGPTTRRDHRAKKRSRRYPCRPCPHGIDTLVPSRAQLRSVPSLRTSGSPHAALRPGPASSRQPSRRREPERTSRLTISRLSVVRAASLRGSEQAQAYWPA